MNIGLNLLSHKIWTQMQNIGQQIPLYLVVFHNTDDWLEIDTFTWRGLLLERASV